jgi:predicted Zn-dependent protease
MLLKLRNEAELAGVLAHEIGHIVRKHHLNAIQSSSGKLAIKEGTSLFMDAKGKTGKTDQLWLNAISAGTEIYGKGLDKEDEFDSDRVGVVLAARAGYDPYGLPAALHTLQSITSDSSSLQLMLETHPKPNDRLAQLDQIMGKDFDRYDNLPALQGRFEKILGRLKASTK